MFIADDILEPALLELLVLLIFLDESLQLLVGLASNLPFGVCYAFEKRHPVLRYRHVRLDRVTQLLQDG